jgi:hypothetical protein
MKTLKEHLNETQFTGLPGQPAQQPVPRQQRPTPPPRRAPEGGTSGPTAVGGRRTPNIPIDQWGKPVSTVYTDFQKNVQDTIHQQSQQLTKTVDNYIGNLKSQILQTRPNWGERMQGFRNFMGNIWDELRGVRQQYYQPPGAAPRAQPQSPATYGSKPNPWYGANQPRARQESVMPLAFRKELLEGFDKLKRDILLLPLREAGEEKPPYAGANWSGYANAPAYQNAAERGGDQNMTPKDRAALNPTDVDNILWNFRSQLLGAIEKSLQAMSDGIIARNNWLAGLEQKKKDQGSEDWWMFNQANQGGYQQPIVVGAGQGQAMDVPVPFENVAALEKTLMELNLD